jgi:hypothetical protein
MLEANLSDEPVLISANVEDRASPVKVSVREHLPGFE